MKRGKLKFTRADLDALARNGLGPDDVFDARGITTDWQTRTAYAKDAGFECLVGPDRCQKCGNTVRTRSGSGQCLVCNPAALSFQRRHRKPGWVYIARSPSTRLIKVGYMAKLGARDHIDLLNEQRYGETSDWRLCVERQVDHGGRIKKLVHRCLFMKRAPSRKYWKDGHWMECDELFRCTIKEATEALKKVTAESDRSTK